MLYLALKNLHSAVSTRLNIALLLDATTGVISSSACSSFLKIQSDEQVKGGGQSKICLDWTKESLSFMQLVLQKIASKQAVLLQRS